MFQSYFILSCPCTGLQTENSEGLSLATSILFFNEGLISVLLTINACFSFFSQMQRLQMYVWIVWQVCGRKKQKQMTQINRVKFSIFILISITRNSYQVVRCFCFDKLSLFCRIDRQRGTMFFFAVVTEYMLSLKMLILFIVV